MLKRIQRPERLIRLPLLNRSDLLLHDDDPTTDQNGADLTPKVAALYEPFLD